MKKIKNKGNIIYKYQFEYFKIIITNFLIVIFFKEWKALH